MSEENKRGTIYFSDEMGSFIESINSAKTTDVIFNTLIKFKKSNMHLPEYAGGKAEVFIGSAINKTKELLKLDNNDDLLLVEALESLDFSSNDFNEQIKSIKEKISCRNSQGIHISNLNEKRKQSNTKKGCCLQ